MDDRKICRLCLESINDNNFVALGTIVKSMLSGLRLNLDLDIVKDPVSCTDCVKALQNCCDYKWRYVYAHKNVSSSGKLGDDKICLLDFCLKPNQGLKLNVSKNFDRVCRFCYAGANGIYTDLYDPQDLLIVGMLSAHIPEVTLVNTDDLIACEICLISLKRFSNFILKCEEVEKKIRHYKELAGIGDQCQLELSDMNKIGPLIKYEYVPNNIDGDSNSCNVLNATVKTEMTIEDLASKGNVDMHIKCEEIYIKSEDSDYESNNTVEEPEQNEVQKYKCKLCPYKGKRINYFKHMGWHKRGFRITVGFKKHSLKYRCNLCPYQTLMKKYMNRHLKIHLNQSKQYGGSLELIKCKKCPFVSLYKSSRINHMHVHMYHPNARKIRCDYCPYAAISRKTIKRHLQIKHDLPQMGENIKLCKRSTSPIKRKVSKVFKYDSCSYKIPRNFNLQMFKHKT